MGSTLSRARYEHPSGNNNRLWDNYENESSYRSPDLFRRFKKKQYLHEDDAIPSSQELNGFQQHPCTYSFPALSQTSSYGPITDTRPSNCNHEDLEVAYQLFSDHGSDFKLLQPRVDVNKLHNVPSTVDVSDDVTQISNMVQQNNPTDVSAWHKRLLVGDDINDSDGMISDISRTSSMATGSHESSIGSDLVDVTIKWRNCENPISSSIKSVHLIYENMSNSSYPHLGSVDFSKTISLLFDREFLLWRTDHNLKLPAGQYKINFLLNNDFKTHSDYLPIIKYKDGSISNYFEVLPGYKSLEPYYHPKASSIVTDYKENSSDSNDQYPITSINVIQDPSSKSSSILLKQKAVTINYVNDIPELFKFSDASKRNDRNFARYGFIEPAEYGEPSLEHNVLDCQQDVLFATLQQNGAVDFDTAERILLKKYPVPELPIHLDSYYLEKTLPSKNTDFEVSIDSSTLTIPHVNLNHLLAKRICDDVLVVASTTRYRGKFVTQVLYTSVTSSLSK